MQTRWTIAELGRLVEAALEEGYEGPANGRVRAVPDRRTIRYYNTLGLLDAPAEMRGRTALYSRRHLLQLVAIKRLQAQGLSLAKVQERLTGLTTEAIADIAGLDAGGAEPIRATAATERADRESFWSVAPSAPQPAPLAEPQPRAAPHPAEAPAQLPVATPCLRIDLAPGISIVVDTDALPSLSSPREQAALARAAQPLVRFLSKSGLTSAT